MIKQPIRVLVRTRPTSNFAFKNFEVDTAANVQPSSNTDS